MANGSQVDYPSALSERQELILILAHDEGVKVGFPETVQAIAYQESILGTYKFEEFGIVGDVGCSPGKRAYGVMQVKVETAWRVLKAYPELSKGRRFLTDEHLIVALLMDDRFNISIGAHYFLMMYRVDKKWNKGLLRYNGVSDLSTDPNSYKSGIWSHITTLVRPFNRGEY